MKFRSKNAIAVYITLKSIEEEDNKIVDELSLLLDTAGYIVVDKKIIKQNQINTTTYISKGKLEDIITELEGKDIGFIIFDNELSPSQVSNIEKLAEGIKVYTRTEIILEIFSMRAKTSIAKKQVELAYLEFEYPRLKGKWGGYDRIYGGIGVRGGQGETQLEYDRRHARERIAKLKKELEKVETQYSTTRKNRYGSFRVAIVGYTNAGKSTLFNKLTREKAYTEDKLFATLDTQTRKLYLDDTTPMEVIISDTVGFIDRLPHNLVASFKSTLSEVSEANLLIHLIDSSSDNMDNNILAVKNTIAEIKADNIKSVLVFNKSDTIDINKKNEIITKYESPIFISAITGEGIDLIKKYITHSILNTEQKI